MMTEKPIIIDILNGLVRKGTVVQVNVKEAGIADRRLLSVRCVPSNTSMTEEPLAVFRYSLVELPPQHHTQWVIPMSAVDRCVTLLPSQDKTHWLVTIYPLLPETTS